MIPRPAPSAAGAAGPFFHHAQTGQAIPVGQDEFRPGHIDQLPIRKPVQGTADHLARRTDTRGHLVKRQRPFDSLLPGAREVLEQQVGHAPGHRLEGQFINHRAGALHPLNHQPAEFPAHFPVGQEDRLDPLA